MYKSLGSHDPHSTQLIDMIDEDTKLYDLDVAWHICPPHPRLAARVRRLPLGCLRPRLCRWQRVFYSQRPKSTTRLVHSW